MKTQRVCFNIKKNKMQLVQLYPNSIYITVGADPDKGTGHCLDLYGKKSQMCSSVFKTKRAS